MLPFAGAVAFLNSGSFFDEFDYWAGTFALVVFAASEAVLFAWVFGMDKAWAEIGKGAEMRPPLFFYPIIKYVTPTFLLVILVAFTFMPEGLVPARDGEGKPVLKDGQPVLLEKGWEPYLIGWATGDKPPAWQWSSGGMIGKLIYRDLAKQRAGLEAKLSQAQLPEQEKKEAQEALAFLPQLQNLRQIDRVAMIGSFLFFCTLVAIAWNKRAAKQEAKS